jgi:hypothetical protein
MRWRFEGFGVVILLGRGNVSFLEGATEEQNRRLAITEPE